MQRLFPILFFSIGLILLGICGVVTWRTNSFLVQAESAAGVVLRLERFRDSDCRDCYLYSPVVRFRTAAGEDITFTSGWRSRPAGFSSGDVVTVVYSRDDPDSATIATFWQLWGTSLILGIIGGTFSLLSTILLYAFNAPLPRKREKKGMEKPPTVVRG